MTTTLRLAPYLLGLLLTLLAGAAHAACSDPAGVEGDVLYNAEFAAVQYCDDTNWIAVNGTVQVNSGLIAHWTFGDGSGTTAADVTGSGHDGSLEASMTDEDWIPGPLGTALSFDGMDDNVDVGDPGDGSLDFDTTQSLTYMAWVRSDDVDTMALSKRDSSVWGYEILVGGNSIPGRFLCRLHDASGTKIDYDTGAEDDWHHIACVVNRGTDEFIMYVDGSAVGSPYDISSAPTLANGITLRIGSRGPGSTPCECDVDDVRIYDRALSAAEVQALYDMGAPGVDLDADLVGHWPLDETGGATIADRSGNGNDGTWVDGVNDDVTEEAVIGVISGGIDFTGDHIDLGEPAAIDLTGAMSISAWVKPAINQNNSIVGRQRGNPRGYELGTNSGTTYSTAEFQVGSPACNTSLTEAAGSTEMINGEWYHVVGTFEPSSALRVYVNGNLDGENTTGIPASQCANNNVRIGRRPDGLQAFQGTIDDVRIYDRALTAKEVRAVYKQANLCASPPGLEGEIFFNGDEDVLQWCNGNRWVAAGPNPGSPGDAGCANPTGAQGDLIYNGDYKTAQYCDGTLWQRMGNPCNAAAPAPGTVCEDGTVYAGLVGSAKIFTTRCDYGMTWDGTACTGSRTALPWNNGNTSGYVAVGTSSNAYGYSDTVTLVETDADSVTSGFQPHQAAQTCYDLDLHGRTDWYLPARDEMGAINANYALIGGLSVNSFYWDVRDNGNSNAALGKLITGPNTSDTKSDSNYLRCVRRN